MKISVSKGVKAGVGKYEMVNVDVSIEYDVPGLEKKSDAVINDEFARAYEICDNQINNQLTEISSMLKIDSVFATTHVEKRAGVPTKSRERK